MATYENLHGRRVNVVSSNPSNPKEGEVWYNSTLGLLKGYVLGPATVESAGNVNTARTQMGSTGALTAGLMFGGESPSLTGATEEFDGSSFSNGGTCPATKSDMHSSGTQTAALWGGGSPSSSGSFEYDGSSWTGGGAMTFAGRDFYGGGVGTQTAALQVGGFISPGNLSAVMQHYDGSSWTNIPQTFPTAPLTGGMASCGTQTACLSTGGPPNSTSSLSWDGSSWTTAGSLSIGFSGHSQRGTVSSANIISGHPASPPTYSTQILTWDGSSWSTSSSTLSEGRAQAAGFGAATAAAVASGADGTPNYTNTSEVFTEAAVATKTLTTG
jgi:hypothetical protein